MYVTTSQPLVIIGERQRIAVVRALANNPKIILADEPASSLDDENSTLLMGLLEKINKERGTTILLATTDLYKKLPTNRDYVLKDGNLHNILLLSSYHK